MRMSLTVSINDAHIEEFHVDAGAALKKTLWFLQVKLGGALGQQFDECAAPLDGIDDAFVGQEIDGTAHGHGASAVAAAEPSLRR
jgi:hypothetical protein